MPGPAWVVDLSAGGAGVVTISDPELTSRVHLAVDVGYTTIAVDAIVRSSIPNQDGSRRRRGLQLLDVSEDALDEILRCVALGATAKRHGSVTESIRLLPGDFIDLTVVGDEAYESVETAVSAVDRVEGRVRLDLARQHVPAVD